MTLCTTFSLNEEEKQNISLLNFHRFTFLRFFQTDEDVLILLPQGRVVRLCLSLPADPEVPEREDGVSICVHDSV